MKKILNIILSTMVFFGVTAELFAAGTPAGTVIQSRSRAIYTTASGAVSDTVYSGIVSIVVKQIGAFNIAPAADVKVSQSDSSYVDYSVQITNSGNGTDIGRFTAVSSLGWATQVFADINGDGTLQAEEVVAGPISRSSSLNADTDYSVVVRVAVPRDESLNGKKDTTTIIVSSDYDAAISVSGTYITTVQSANVAGVANGLNVNNPAPNAGTNVVYTLTFTNTGSRPATAVTAQNVIPAGLTYISSTISQGTVNSSGAPIIIWNIGTVPVNGTVSISYSAMVNGSLLPGTVIQNQMSVNYTVGLNNYLLGSNVVSLSVGGVLSYGVQLIPFTTSATREAADTALYRMSVRNTGSFTDVIEVASVSSQSLSWAFYSDTNNNGLLDPGDVLLTNTNAAAGIDTDSLAAGDSVRIFARIIIPRVVSDMVKDSLQVTVVSSGDNSQSASILNITTVQSPVVLLSKEIFPIGDQPAGSVMTYTITYSNTGSVGVDNFSVIDVTPPSTEYIMNSVRVNGLAVNDNTGSVSILDDPANNKVITVSIGALNAQSTGTVEFKVKIK
jgi:uncharacterized repeat protein (TIGR01451 family)